MMRLAGLMLLVLVSCNDESIQSKISKADRVEIIDQKTNFSHVETGKEIVEDFKSTFDNPAAPTDCTPQGTILFKRGDKTIFQAGYYKDASACDLFIVDDNGKKTGYPYNHDVLLYLGLYFQNLKKQHVANHN